MYSTDDCNRSLSSEAYIAFVDLALKSTIVNAYCYLTQRAIWARTGSKSKAYSDKGSCY